VDPEPGPQVLLFGQLEAHHMAVSHGRAVEREAGRIGAAMLHGLKHPGHLPAHVGRLALVDDSSNTAHLV
jgi:hypothetical protein